MDLDAEHAEPAASSPSTSQMGTDMKFVFAVPQVWKVFEKGHLDYWVYGISLETNMPQYTQATAAPEDSSSTRYVTIHSGRCAQKVRLSMGSCTRHPHKDNAPWSSHLQNQD